MYVLENTPATRAIAGKRVHILEDEMGEVTLPFKGQKLNFRAFPRHGRDGVSPDDIVANKLRGALAHIRKQQQERETGWTSARHRLLLGRRARIERLGRDDDGTELGDLSCLRSRARPGSGIESASSPRHQARSLCFFVGKLAGRGRTGLASDGFPEALFRAP